MFLLLYLFLCSFLFHFIIFFLMVMLILMFILILILFCMIAERGRRFPVLISWTIECSAFWHLVRIFVLRLLRSWDISILGCRLLCTILLFFFLCRLFLFSLLKH